MTVCFAERLARMDKLRRLLGLPVLELEHGTRLGEVQEVVLNVEQAAVAGVVIAEPTWFSHVRGITFADLHGIGRDALTVRDAGAVRDFTAALGAFGAQKLQALCDRQIFTEDGEYLGVLADVVCVPETGEIRFYELSDGFITDFLNGRSSMPLPPVQVVGEDRLIVPAAMAKLLQAANHDPGGVV
ncbi:MAG TPA: PRC-barrel domain-containing protein [Negativicutes bacterium]|nr:PRC-barrel domain-containing protein [Negativicutes bacterium]